MGNRNIIHRYDTHKNGRCMKGNIKRKLCNIIHDFLHPSIESIMKSFAIVEDATITQEEAEELLKMLDEWEGHNS